MLTVFLWYCVTGWHWPTEDPIETQLHTAKVTLTSAVWSWLSRKNKPTKDPSAKVVPRNQVALTVNGPNKPSADLRYPLTNVSFQPIPRSMPPSRDLMSKSHIQHHSATVTWNCWKYFGNLKRVTNTRDYQPTIHSGTQMWTCAPRRNFRGKDSISRQQIRLPRTQSMLKQLITMDCWNILGRFVVCKPSTVGFGN